MAKTSPVARCAAGSDSVSHPPLQSELTSLIRHLPFSLMRSNRNRRGLCADWLEPHPGSGGDPAWVGMIMKVV
jgi:hypothetical protein